MHERAGWPLAVRTVDENHFSGAVPVRLGWIVWISETLPSLASSAVPGSRRRVGAPLAAGAGGIDRRVAPLLVLPGQSAGVSNPLTGAADVAPVADSGGAHGS